MADDETKPARKRPARKRPTRTTTPASEEPTSEAAPDDSGDTAPAAPGREVVAVTTAGSDAAGLDEDIAGEVAAPLVPGQDQLGTLTVHYEVRSVQFTLDGFSAAKVMSVFAGVMNRFGASDLLVPAMTPMNTLWATISLDGVLAMSWIPGLPGLEPRTVTVDPPVPAPA